MPSGNGSQLWQQTKVVPPSWTSTVSKGANQLEPPIPQSVLIQQPIPGSGDLIVRMNVTTDLQCAITERARQLDFDAGDLGGIHIGTVLGIDANGNRIEGYMRFDGEHLDLALPAAFVDQATYPIDVDPILGGRVGTGRSFSDNEIDIAFDVANDVYGVVDQTEQSATDHDIRASHGVWNGAAQLVDSFLIEADAGFDQSRPCVALMSSKYVAAWIDVNANSTDIEATHLGLDTAARCGNEVVISGSAARAMTNPAIVSRLSGGDAGSDSGLLSNREEDLANGNAVLGSRVYTTFGGGPVNVVTGTGGCSNGATAGVSGPAALGNQNFKITLGDSANATSTHSMAPAVRIALITLLGAAAARAQERYDVVVYGCTSAGVMAAVQAERMGRSVVLVGPDRHLGGLSAGGLGWTDSGKKEVIGGLAREFYGQVFEHYARDRAWTWQARAEYGDRGQGPPAIDGGRRTMWIFEPHVAEQVFESLVDEHDIPVYRDEWLDRANGVDKRDRRIRSIAMLSGRTFAGAMFIDATYEGDLMAAAGVSYTVGREANSRYGETLNGVQTGRARSHQFEKPVDPYVVPGDPSSGLLPRIHGLSPGEEFRGDHRVQAYCFRTCMTDHPDNLVPWPKPEGYDPLQYELALRYLEAGWREVFRKFDPVPNRKTDTNNHGAFSFDNIGFNYGYPEGSYDERREIVAEHETYQKGLLWFLANDPRVPGDIQREMQRWGLAADEFTDNGNWPHQIYVREARRMVGDWVQTELHLRRQEPTPRPIGMGSYNMDSHNVQRYVDENGHARNEGDIQVSPGGPYPVDYGAIVPEKTECENLLVPVCISSSHIAYGSIRMEPVFMILGQSAATAASLSIEENVAVQDLDYALLEARLRADGQVLGDPVARYTPLSALEGTVVDDTEAALEGPWRKSTIAAGVHRGYLHDGDLRDGSCRATFTADLEPGRYEVQLAYTVHENRATNVPVRLNASREVHRYTVNQRRKPNGPTGFHTLDTLFLGGPTTMLIANRETDGHVIVDAVRFVKR